MSLFKEFATDQDNEKSGVWTELGDNSKLKLRRAGGSNKEFEVLQTELTKPFQKRIRLSGGSIPNTLLSTMRKISVECFSKTVVCGWQTKIKDEEGNESWHDGIEGVDIDEATGKRSERSIQTEKDLWPVTETNIRKMFTEFPDFFEVVMEVASDAAAFRDEGLEAMAGNS